MRGLAVRQKFSKKWARSVKKCDATLSKYIVSCEEVQVPLWQCSNLIDKTPIGGQGASTCYSIFIKSHIHALDSLYYSLIWTKTHRPRYPCQIPWAGLTWYYIMLVALFTANSDWKCCGQSPIPLQCNITTDRILAPCNYCHHPWCVSHTSYHKALLIMFGCDGISDHASWNEVFH